MGTDYFFRMGTTHAICQDYALAGVKNGVPFAMVSDGCSGSPTGEPGSPFTDYGARFLVRAALHHLEYQPQGLFPASPITCAAAEMARACGLRHTSLDATLIVAVAVGQTIRVFQTGDGVVAARYPDGSIKYTSLQYGGNAPYYMSYLLDQQRHEQYTAEAKTVMETSGIFTPGGGWKPLAIICDPLGELVQQHMFHGADIVLIMSDGAQSFVGRDGSVVPLETVLEELFAIKSFTGEFLVRRCNAFLKRLCAERGWSHADDFSVAGIYLGDTL